MHILHVCIIQVLLTVPSNAALAPLQSSRAHTSTPKPVHHTRRDDTSKYISRRQHIACLFSLVAGPAILTKPAFASETVGKDEACDDASCLGIWDGLLADCPHGKLAMNSGAGCVSSQDDTPGVFAEPWDYSEAPNNSLDYKDQMRLLKPTIELVCSKRGDTVQYLVEDGRYLRAIFADAKTKEKSVGETFRY